MLRKLYPMLLFAIALPALAQEPEGGGAEEAPQQVHGLNEVVVTEAPVVREAGKDSYIITPELREGTMSAAQLMRRLQGFVVDPISESVSIAKDKDIPVVVNDKEVTHKYAMSLNPERIKRIEVLRYPAGRFSGIPILINIVLNSNYIGTDGSLYATADAVLNGSATNSQSAGANVVSSFGRWSVFGTAQFEHNLQYNSRGRGGVPATNTVAGQCAHQAERAGVCGGRRLPHQQPAYALGAVDPHSGGCEHA